MHRPHRRTQYDISALLDMRGYDVRTEYTIGRVGKGGTYDRVDIAIPSLHIAIEVWTDPRIVTHRRVKDREARLAAHGWSVLNVSAEECDMAMLMQRVEAIAEPQKRRPDYIRSLRTHAARWRAEQRGYADAAERAGREAERYEREIEAVLSRSVVTATVEAAG
jgi:hypothetical protein